MQNSAKPATGSIFQVSEGLVSENDLFLTLGSGTTSARNENLRPLLNTNISLISGKYGLLAVGKSFSHEEK